MYIDKLQMFAENEKRTREPDTNNKIRGSLNKFPDFFRMGTFIDSTHMKL